MTSNEMLILIRNRTIAFYERVFSPFGLYEKGDLEHIDESLKRLFSEERRRSALTISFLACMDKAETEIVLHKREPKSFFDEMLDVFCNAKKWESDPASFLF
jgi:hypothetical protein